MKKITIILMVIIGLVINANAHGVYRHVGRYSVPVSHHHCTQVYYPGTVVATPCCGNVVGVVAPLGTLEGDRYYYHQPAHRVAAPTTVVEVIPTSPTTAIVTEPVVPVTVSQPSVAVTKSFENTTVVVNNVNLNPPPPKDNFFGVAIFGLKIGINL